MSNLDNLKNDDFTFVSYKKKYTKKIQTNNLLQSTDVCKSDTFDINTAIRRILDAKEDIQTSDFYSSVTASLREGLDTLNKQSIQTIICFGLGKIGECMISRYQLALLICLKELFDANVESFDPIFNNNERELLNHFNIIVPPNNSEGKYNVNNKTTLFFLPHCPKQLTNNLLWSNWGLNLSNCIIISNSFDKILENNTKRIIRENANYLLNISPYVTELAIINSFKYYEIFNDTAIHIFPTEKLTLISSDFWNDCIEPTYLLDDIEFITNKIENI